MPGTRARTQVSHREQHGYCCDPRMSRRQGSGPASTRGMRLRSLLLWPAGGTPGRSAAGMTAAPRTPAANGRVHLHLQPVGRPGGQPVA